MREAVIVAAARTPVGRLGGVLASLKSFELASVVIKEVVGRAGIDPGDIDDVIFGNLFAGDVGNLARVALLEAGLPLHVPGVTIDRQCSSSLNAIALGAALIEAGHAEVIVAGGAESDSNRALLARQDPSVNSDTSRVLLSPDKIGNPRMGVTAENLAIKYRVTREECDTYAAESHRRAGVAWREGRFAEQVMPVAVPQPDGSSAIVSLDECVRLNTTSEVLAALPPVFKPDGVLTAGNSSPMSDGAGAVVLMEKNLAMSQGLEPLAIFRGYATLGVDPNLMGIGPVPATQKLLNRRGLSLKDIDLLEINEAFSAQIIPVIRELHIDVERLNVNGGAIALGHPLGGTGAILTTKLVYEMRRSNARYGLVSFCSGGGQGFSALFERGLN